MRKNIEDHFKNTLRHLYINPLEKCNLKCKICYTKKTSAILTEKQILEFIKRYQKKQELQTITFCGGEVFTLKYFPHLINILTKEGIFIQTITNGTVNRLSEITQPNLNKLIVSLDGLEAYHDQNRGEGSFKKSLSFLKDAQKKGFHIEIFSIVTRQNYSQIEPFEKYLFKKLGPINITYHPRKPISYLSNHPISNITGDIKGFDFLAKQEYLQLLKTKNVFPPKDLGCYQIALFSDGKVYGCCEGFLPLGTINNSINRLIDLLQKRISGPKLGCSQCNFMCGLKSIYFES